MARKYTVTFNDGTKHEYNGAPDDLSQEALTAQAKTDFPGKTITHLDREQTTGEYVNGLVRSAAQGATFGFADEGEAALESLVGAAPYDEALAKQRAMTKSFSDQNPVSATLANVGGAIGSGFGLAKGAGIAAPRLAAEFKMLPPALQAMVLGGGQGAVTGFGEGEGGFVDRSLNALIGMAAGGVLGPAAHGVGQFAQYLRSTPTDRAAAYLNKMLGRDKMTPDQAMTRLDELGPVSTLADLGPNMQGAGAAVASVPGEGKAAAQMLNARQVGDTGSAEVSGQAKRILDASGKALGGTNYYGAIDDLYAEGAAKAKPLYDAAYAVRPMWGTPETAKVQELLKRASVKDALAKAERIASDDGVDPRSIGFDANGQITPQGSSIQTLDYVKRGLDEMIEAERHPITGRLSTAGGRIAKVRQDLVDELDILAPDYGKARAAYAGPAASRDALALGRAALDPEQALEVTAKDVAKLLDSDKAFFRQGVARRIEEIVTKSPDGADAVKRIFGNQNIRAKLAAAFPDKASFDEFAKTMQAEAQMFSTRGAVLQGSRTAPLSENIKDLGAPLLMDAAGAVATGNPTNMLVKAGNYILDKTSGRIRESTANELAKYMFSPSGLARQDIQRLLTTPRSVAAMDPGFAALIASGAVAGGNAMNRSTPLQMNITTQNAMAR